MLSNFTSRVSLTSLSAALLLGSGFTAGVAAVFAVAVFRTPEPEPKAPAAERFAWVDGKIAPVREAFGIPEDELRFLDEFDRPIVDGLPEDREQLRARMRAMFDIGWSRTAPLVRARFPELDERAAMFMFAVLRVNGSLPVYEPRRRAPRDLNGLLIERRGNCTEATLRLLMWLDTIGISGRIMQFWTPSLPGHVVADIYDPQSGRAYMLDASMNVLSWVPSQGAGFFDTVFAMSPQARVEYFTQGRGTLVTAPFFQRWFDPGMQVDRGGAQSLDDLNWAHYEPRMPRWRASLTTEVEAIRDRWRKVWPGGLPRTLDQFGNPAIKDFGIENVLPAEPLLVSSGLALPKWGKPERVDHVGPLRTRLGEQRDARERALSAGGDPPELSAGSGAGPS